MWNCGYTIQYMCCDEAKAHDHNTVNVRFEAAVAPFLARTWNIAQMCHV